jgi:hypothetical protein
MVILLDILEMVGVVGFSLPASSLSKYTAAQLSDVQRKVPNVALRPHTLPGTQFNRRSLSWVSNANSSTALRV